MEDKGDSNFAQYVIMNSPIRVKSVVIMEDLCGWKSTSVGINVTKNQAILCLKNVAILHAKFWGEKGKFVTETYPLSKMEKDYRQTRYSKMAAMMRKRAVSSTESIQKLVEKFLTGKFHLLLFIPYMYKKLYIVLEYI